MPYNAGLYEIAMAALLACTFITVFFLTRNISRLSKQVQAMQQVLKPLMAKQEAMQKKPVPGRVEGKDKPFSAT